MVRRVALFVLLVAVVALLFWSGVHNLRARRAQMQAQQAARVVVSKDASTDSTSEVGGAPMGSHLRGKPAPAFTLPDLSGKKISLADFHGKPVVINFWATWCAPCQLEMPWFQQFAGKYATSGLTVLGINEDDGAPRDQIQKSLERAGVKYPTLLGTDAVSKAYGGVDYLPETFYIDRKGNVVEETAGAPSRDEIEANFKRLTSGPAAP